MLFWVQKEGFYGQLCGDPLVHRVRDASDLFLSSFYSGSSFVTLWNFFWRTIHSGNVRGTGDQI